MPLVQDRSFDLLTSTPARYDCTTHAPFVIFKSNRTHVPPCTANPSDRFRLCEALFKNTFWPLVYKMSLHVCVTSEKAFQGHTLTTCMMHVWQDQSENRHYMALLTNSLLSHVISSLPPRSPFYYCEYVCLKNVYPRKKVSSCSSVCKHALSFYSSFVFKPQIPIKMLLFRYMHRTMNSLLNGTIQNLNLLEPNDTKYVLTPNLARNIAVSSKDSVKKPDDIERKAHEKKARLNWNKILLKLILKF